MTFRVDGQSVPGMLDVSDDSSSSANVSCTVKAMRSGSATLTVCDKATGDELGSFVLSVAAPVIKYEGNISDTHWLVPDGTARNLPAHYETTDRQVMTVAATDAEGFGLKFAPTLYASSLGDVAAVAGTHADAPLLGFDGRYVFLRYFQNAGRTAVFNTVMPDAVRLSSGLCPDVVPVSLTAGIYKPVEGYLGDNIVIDDWSLFGDLGWDEVQTRAIAWKARPESTILYPGTRPTAGGGSVSTKVARDYSTVTLANEGLVNGMVEGGIPTYDNIDYQLGPGGSVLVTVTPGGKSKGIGQFAISFVVTNFRSNQSYQTKIGTMKIYLHTAIGGWVSTYQTSWGGYGPGYTCAVYNYPLGYYKVPSEFNNMLEACMDLPQSVHDMINGYPRPRASINGASFSVDYNYPGLVTWSPDAGVYEIDFDRVSSEGGSVDGDDCKRAVYNQYMPQVIVSKEKRNAAGLMYDLLEYPEDSDKWYYALGGMKDATNHNLGYYVFEFFTNISPSTRGWFDYSPFTVDPPGGQRP